MSDLRKNIGDALGDKFDREKLDELLESMLQVTKGARGWCPNCNKAVMVEINDSVNVAKMLKDLNAEAWGRPQDDKVEAEGMTLVRKVIYGCESCGCDACKTQLSAGDDPFAAS